MCKTDYKELEQLEWGKWVNRFLDHLKYDLERSPETVSGYRKDLFHFGSNLVENNGPKITPKKLNPMDIWVFLRHLNQVHGYAPRSRSRNLATIKSFYKFLKLNEYVKKDPSVAIQWPNLPKDEKPTYFTLDEFQNIVNAINTKKTTGYVHWVMIHLLFLTGMRISEALSLTSSDVDLRKRLIYVREAKGNKSRDIPISESLYPILSEYKKKLKLKAEQWLFASAKSTCGHLSSQNVRLFIKKYCKLAGIKKAKMSPHVFRHGFATTLYQEHGVDLLRIATLLGHSSTRTTEIYAHTSDKHLKKAVDLIKL